MIVHKTAIDAVVKIERAIFADERGFFSRLHCPHAFAEAGHPFSPVQTSLSRNVSRGTLRGLHWQDPPHAETKLVRVVRGRVFDVCVDIRRDSPTYRQWVGLHLDAEDGMAVLIGEGIAHGFLTCVDDTDVLYQISPGHTEGHAKGARWNDPAFAIEWPMAPLIVSQRDMSFETFADGAANGNVLWP